MAEEYEELDHKNVIAASSTSIVELKKIATKKCKTKDYISKLAEIRERLQKRMNNEVDSDYSY